MRSRSFILSSFGRPARFFSTASTKMSAIFSAFLRETLAAFRGRVRVGAVAILRCSLGSVFMLTRTFI